MTRAMQEAIARLEDAVDAWKMFREFGEIDEHYEFTLQELRLDVAMAEANLIKKAGRSKS